jgi:hypothetical protein
MNTPNTQTVNKTREQRVQELKAKLAIPSEARLSVPFVEAGSMDNNGIITLKIDSISLLDGMHLSSTGKSKCNFQSVQLPLGIRLNINAIGK